MSSNSKAAAIAAVVSIVCGMFCMAVVSLRESRAERAAQDALDVALDAKDKVRIGSWHLKVAATEPNVGMPVTWREKDGSERAAFLAMKVQNNGWMLAVFDQARAEWAVIGPMVEGTRDEPMTWTPAICGAIRPRLRGDPPADLPPLSGAALGGR